MKQYLLFTGQYYYPCGGWDDFIADFDSIKEAANAFKNGPKAFYGDKYRVFKHCDWDWGQVIDIKTMEVTLKLPLENGQS